MPNAESIRMEDVSEAYVRALCAVNGYSLTKSNHDNDGYDIEVECKGQVASDSLRYSPMVQMQLKASYAKIKEHPDGSITYPLEVKNYQYMILINWHVPLRNLTNENASSNTCKNKSYS